MSLRTIAVATALVALPFTAAACGGADDTNSGSRPAPAEVSKALQDSSSGALDAKVSDCIAGKLDSSDIPNGVLRKLVDGKEAKVDKDNEKKYTKILTDASVACASASINGG